MVIDISTTACLSTPFQRNLPENTELYSIKSLNLETEHTY